MPIFVEIAQLFYEAVLTNSSHNFLLLIMNE
jgi:hypothetical protein